MVENMHFICYSSILQMLESSDNLSDKQYIKSAMTNGSKQNVHNTTSSDLDVVCMHAQTLTKVLHR